MNTQTVNTMWETRPARIPSNQGGNAKIAGVCEGIGVRYQVDPTLVRILFVAAGLIGGGLGVYIVAWLIMPRYSMALSPIEAVLKNAGPEYKQEKETGWWLIVALVVFGFSASNTTGDLLGGSTIVSLVLAFAAWYYLHSRQPEPPKVDLPMVSPAPGFTMPTPPAWDPLGAAPQLWHLPEPGTVLPQDPEPKKKSHGWMWIAAAVAIVAVSAVATSTLDYNDEVGDITVAVTVEDQLQDKYSNGVGTLTLDFSDLEPLSKDHDVVIENGVGDVVVTLPKEVPVRVQCEAGVGDLDCSPGNYNFSADTTSKVLNLRLEAGVGSVQLKH